MKQLLQTIEQYKGLFPDAADDAFITGVIAEEAGIARHNNYKIQLSSRNGKCQTHVSHMSDYLIIKCDGNEDQRQLWKEWKNISQLKTFEERKDFSKEKKIF